LAAVWANYTWEEFEELEGDRQAFIVSAYRSNNQIEAVLNESQRKKMESKSRPKTPRKGQ
jgi:hypothetical protein